MDLRVGNKYRIGRKIGAGSFGDIYLGKIVKLVFFFYIFKKLILPNRNELNYGRRGCHQARVS